ncbi:MAG: DNA polymerase I [Anaerolineales bacterium]|jgi:DNA polymerase I
MPPTLYLLDGHALAYRTYYALTRGTTSGFSTRSGEPTAGVFGFTSVLLRILEQDQPDYLAVAFDTGKTFRDEIFPEYKGTREKMPDDLQVQIERVRQLVDAFNIPRIEVENYEADDVLGSLAKKAAAQGLGVKIITGDRDLLQLVEERIIVNLPGKSLSDAKDYRAEDVEAYIGVPPQQIVDFKALVGDKSDNIPGVTGVGEKTAINLLKTYQTLDGVYEHLDDLSSSLHKKLEAGRQDAYLSQKLATIVTDLDLSIDLQKARVEHFDPQVVEALFRELEFRTLLTRLENLVQSYGLRSSPRGQQLSFLGEQPVSLEGSSGVQSPIRAQLVDSPEALDALVTRLNSSKVISFDVESTSTDQMRADLVGIALAIEEDQGYYVPVGHKAELGPQLPLQTVLEALRGPLTDAHIPKVGHNIKYDYVLLARNGLRVSPLAFDTMIAEWLSNPTSRNLGLKNLAWVRLDIKMTDILELIGKGKEQRTMAQAPIGQCAEYAAADAAVVLRLMSLLEQDLQACQATRVMEEIEMPLVPILAQMEMTGIALNDEFLAGMSAELSVRLAEIESQVYHLVDMPFNIGSTQQLSKALFERLKLQPPDRTRRTASGHYSTSADVLDALRGKHPVVDLVLEHRELSKLKSTYVDALPLQINPNTGRVHTSYNQTGAVTGRIASSDPNLQNIPIRTELGSKVRHAFVAGPEQLLLSVDYSQVELRIVAHMADDQAMLEAFRAGQDIHAATAAAIYGVPIETITKQQRRRAKGINFGLIYGMSAFGLTRATDLTLAESEDFMERYFRQFPGVKRYLDGMRLRATEQGYVETLLGRRRYFPGLKNQRNFNIRNREEREAINAPIQGTAADIMKIAMINVPAALRKAHLSARMLLQVHDELVLECPAGEIDETAALVQQVMEDAYTLKIPLKTDARKGRNWGEMQPLP